MRVVSHPSLVSLSWITGKTKGVLQGKKLDQVTAGGDYLAAKAFKSARNMSWMDSWSRPSKHAATPPPLYLVPGGEATPYCHSCGRVIASRKLNKSQSNTEAIKYCSQRCRHSKPGVTGRKIETAFVSLLNGQHPTFDSSEGPGTTVASESHAPAPPAKKKVKGESRILVSCGEVEEIVFGSRYDPEKVFGRKKNRAKRCLPDTDDLDHPSPGGQVSLENQHDGTKPSDDTDSQKTHEHSNQLSAAEARRAEESSDTDSDVGSVPAQGEKSKETDEAKELRQVGQRRADEREAVRSAARRLCAFGVEESQGAEPNKEGSNAAKRKKKGARPEQTSASAGRSKKCEAVIGDGRVVEASFAKGEWGIRWRE